MIPSIDLLFAQNPDQIGIVINAAHSLSEITKEFDEHWLIFFDAKLPNGVVPRRTHFGLVKLATDHFIPSEGEDWIVWKFNDEYLAQKSGDENDTPPQDDAPAS